MAQNRCFFQQNKNLSSNFNLSLVRTNFDDFQLKKEKLKYNQIRTESRYFDKRHDFLDVVFFSLEYGHWIDFF